jgi:hypothetical protein
VLFIWTGEQPRDAKMKIGKTEAERLAWLKANLRFVSTEELVNRERERLRPKLAEWNRRINDPVRRQQAIDSVWQATKGKSRYD